MAIDIVTLTNWSEPRKVNTRLGARLLRTGPATETFWQAWRSEKDALKAAGVSCSKNTRTGQWEAAWWLAVDGSVITPEVKAAAEAKITESLALSRATDAVIEVPAPEGLAYLPYQRAGIAYALSHPNVLIGDEMGLGKTIQAIGVINSDVSIKRVLVVCPASLKLNWKRELTKWLVRPASIAVANGSFPEADIVIANYDILRKHNQSIRQVQWDLLVVDEAHYTKNAKAQRTTEVWGSKAKDGAWKVTPIPAKRRVALTGTPIVNRPVELWPIIHGLDSETFNNFFKYAIKFCNAHKGRWGWDFTGSSNLPELQDLLRRTLLVRRLKAEVLTELPAKRRQVIELPQNGASEAVAAETAAYERNEELLEQLRAQVELSKASDNPADYEDAVAALKKAISVAFAEISKARHDTAVAKVPYVLEHLHEAIDAGGKVICFAHHHDVIDAIAAEFKDAAVVVDGRVSIENRQAAVDRFQTDPTCTLFVGGIFAAGVGLTLTASSHVVFAELDWVPGNVSQCEDRAHRIGQTESVLVQHLVLEGSLDARMAEIIVAKQKVIEDALDRIHEAQPITPHRKGNDAASANVKRDKITPVAEKITPEQVAAIHYGLQILAGVCDGAHQKDGCGYSKIDSQIGHDLACRPSLSPRAAALGALILRKYHKQLPKEVVDCVKSIVDNAKL